MSEQQSQYGQPAAIIEQPRKVLSLHDGGVREYDAWGWVKISAKFISHIKKLRGAKLAIWQCIALSIDETGTCNLTIKELKELTGYSHTEVIESLKELEEMGYLSVDKDGKRRIYTPEFAARGNGNDPSELVKKVDSSQTDESSGVYQYESSTAPINSTPTFKELKRVKKNFSSELLEKADQKVNFILENEKRITERNSWEGRAFFRPDHLPLVDWYHERTGQTCPKSKQKDWMRALLDWTANSLTVADLQVAYEMDIIWRGVFTSPNQLTEKAIAIKAQKKTAKSKPQAPEIEAWKKELNLG